MSALAPVTWPDVEASARRALVVPIGSCEQHGPHLPLDTDTRIASALAASAAVERAGVHVAPALPLGASGEHAAFPGTLSIGRDALRSLVVELVRHASLHWPCVLLVNGHGGNVEALGEACALLAAEGRRCRSWTASWPRGDAHAGRTETSLMLALDPGAVRLDDARSGNGRSLEELMPVLRSRGVRAVAPNGVLGDPAGASAAEGRAMLDALAAACRAELDLLLGAS